MAHTYYQQSGQPGWGTNSYVFGPPPAPSFQPQASWGGIDYYRAHGMNSDPYFFDQAWNRVRDYGGAPTGGVGVGLHEARHWHRRAYGGSNELTLLGPNEIGHAAAYEAYRTWIHNSSIYEPLSGDIERQREALTGLSVAEAERLMRYSGQPMDHYTRAAATEAAAHTASYIFYQTRDEEHRRSRSRYRRDSYDDPYAYDDELGFPSSRARSRHGRSRSRHGSVYGEAPMIGYSASMGGVSPPYTGHQTPYSGYAPGATTIVQSTYHPNGMPMGSGSMYGQQMGMGVQMPMSAGYAQSMPVGVAPSYGGAVPIAHSRSRTNSMSYGVPYSASVSSMGHAMSTPGMPVAPTTQIVIHKSRKHKHRHHSRHRRSHSSDRDYGYHSSGY